MRHHRELEKANFDQQLHDEIEEFRKLIRSKDFIEQVEVTEDFWCENSANFPILSKLAQALLVIPSSASFIERFFSICGVMSEKYTNIDDDLFQMRSMLRVNFDVLKKI
jgi:hypothetical protein